MNTPTRLAAFTLGLAVVFGGAVGIGHAVGPIDSAKDTGGAEHQHGTTAAAHGPEHEHHGTEDGAAAPAAGALAAFDHGYSLQAGPEQLTAGQSADLSFTVRGPNGAPVTSYLTQHGKDLHLILVRTDLAGYQHVHPTLAADGSWHVPVTFPAAGAYRMVADFTPSGATSAVTLGTGLSVAGDYRPQQPTPPAATAETDGYTVALDGRLEAGKSSRVKLRISRDGAPVTDLEPYLGAYGHLVAIRAGDLGYLHVHPEGEPGDGRTAAGPEVSFSVEAPTAGDYRLFLDFQHAGAVHTAAFSVHADATTGSEGAHE
ncbi:hypothetical protein [Kitasatospora cathayae]|uniref:Heavy metal-binding domain-containing protein n=1 Tax=Kitasatospora cathayae TaxID=3004092 RepID=A0ABY7PYI9_9ACTN|nr:hypothetical protein [Kitasatospora sp. HUAS 3-15]WBP85071.1 hypothetical protein O1G21_03890 [Kitasatospora sp. HUAS 3-15]